MVEYESLGYMERVENEEIENSEKTCYLHHSVSNKNSVITKLRVVFNVSYKI